MRRIILLALTAVASACAANPAAEADNSTSHQIIDTPDHHGFFMLGDDVLFLNHMPIFSQENHMYQAVLRASLPDPVTRKLKELRAANPGVVLNLINIDDEPMTLVQLKAGARSTFDATIHLGYSNAGGGTPGPVAFESVPVTIEQVVYFRHFDYSFDYPEPLRYLMFGTPEQVYMTHLMTRAPDFQHIVRLGRMPEWISPMQIGAGVAINVIGEVSTPIHCSNPLTSNHYNVQFQGQDLTSLPIELDESATIWFSTGNLLNDKDPCAPDRQHDDKR